MFDAALLTEAEALLAAYRARGLKMATAESCTGGLVSALLTAVAGSSDVFERGFVTYSNEAKVEMLGVDPALIAAHGAVSEAVAVAMAEGALKHSRADVAVSITGVAGPGGGSAEKPVGTVWLGFAARYHQAKSKHCLFLGSRDHAREQALREALGCAFYVLNH